MNPPRESWCAHLRTKGMYVPPNPKADLNAPEGSSTATFWCAETLKVTGPDDGLVAPDRCQPGRRCYRCREQPKDVSPPR